MAQGLTFDRVWWRNVQPGEFYNIERHPNVVKGGQGSLYIEIPKSMVPATLEFLDAAGSNVEALSVITIEARVYGRPGQSGPIEFHRKKGGRMRIARQNRQQSGSQRHPAWIAANGFPTAPDDVKNKEEALPYFPTDGLRIFIAKTVEGDYYAGFTSGPRPFGMDPNDPNWELYPASIRRPVGGVIDAN